MWKPEHRRAAARGGLRNPSDLTDAEWKLIEPSIPAAKRGGRKRTVNVHEVVNAIFYVLSTGCQWKALPKDLVPKSIAHYYLMLWEWDPKHIERWLSIGERRKAPPLHVMLFDDLLRDPVGFIKQLARVIEIDEDFYDLLPAEIIGQPINAAMQHDLATEVYARLTDHCRPMIKRLQDLIQRDLSGWLSPEPPSQPS